MNIRILALCLGLPVFLSGCATNDACISMIDHMPIYRYVHSNPAETQPPSLDKADQEFVEKAAKQAGSREEASRLWYVEGMRQWKARNCDASVRLFNKSWLLNPQNYQPYWGFGQDMVETNRFDAAIKFFEKADALLDDPYQEAALLSDLGVAYKFKAKQDRKYFTQANEKFAASVALDPNYPNSWRQWAFSLYDEGDYAGAWEKVKKAQSLNARPFPADFLASLRSRVPEPK